MSHTTMVVIHNSGNKGDQYVVTSDNVSRFHGATATAGTPIGDDLIGWLFGADGEYNHQLHNLVDIDIDTIGEIIQVRFPK